MKAKRFYKINHKLQMFESAMSKLLQTEHSMVPTPQALSQTMHGNRTRRLAILHRCTSRYKQTITTEI